MKACTKCGVEKPLDCFYVNKTHKDGLTSQCKPCVLETNKGCALNSVPNSDKNKEACKKYRTKNKERELIKGRLYKKNNRAKINSYRRERCKTDARFKLNRRMSSGICRGLKKGRNGQRWEGLVGYTKDDLVEHLKTTIQFPYTWDDFVSGKIKFHIDHKIPISAFNYDSPKNPDFRHCWALNNLQLMPAQKNLIKGSRLLKAFQPSLLLQQAQS